MDCSFLLIVSISLLDFYGVDSDVEGWLTAAPTLHPRRILWKSRHYLLCKYASIARAADFGEIPPSTSLAGIHQLLERRTLR